MGGAEHCSCLQVRLGTAPGDTSGKAIKLELMEDSAGSELRTLCNRSPSNLPWVWQAGN